MLTKPETESRSKRMRSVIQISIAFGIFALFCYKIGFEQILVVINTMTFGYLAPFYGFVAAEVMLRAYNWGIMLRLKGHGVSISNLLMSYLIGSFFGTFIPSSLGTDVIRAITLSRRSKVKIVDSVIVLLILNLVGLLGVCLLALIGSPFLLRTVEVKEFVLWIYAFCGGYLILFVLMIGGWRLQKKYVRAAWFEKIYQKINDFSSALALLKSEYVALLEVVGINLLSQFMGIGAVYMIALALKAEVSPTFLIGCIPVIAISRLLPLSFAGFGAEQGVSVLVFSIAGIEPAQAFMISLILSGAGLTVPLIGGGVYLIDKLATVKRIFL